MDRVYKFWTAFKRVMVALFVITFIIAAIHFPYDVDAPLSSQEIEAARKYYTEAYQKPVSKSQVESEYETKYVRESEAMAKLYRVEEKVSAFVKRFNLSDRPVLEIGSGRGYLQDVAQNYTGLDISPSVARFYHKKFILGSATAMPFPNDSFDGVWSIWVFEHVPNPEQAFYEARRVTRDNGVLFLSPAWNSTSWAAEGYEVRPYSDFDLVGKLIKASIPLRSSALFGVISLVPNRIVRNLVALFGPTRLRYHRLTPNYEKYWVVDSDAVNSIDSHEAMLWFRSRGDECLNCEEPSVLMGFTPLIIRVHKFDSTTYWRGRDISTG
jgi:SAM-dependent methyltransferase